MCGDAEIILITKEGQTMEVFPLKKTKVCCQYIINAALSIECGNFISYQKCFISIYEL